MNSESVDLIYLDPPFNSNANYAAPIGTPAEGAEFKDIWALDDLDVEWINLISAKHPALERVLLAAMTNSDKSYLAYMAARLMEMPRLLKPTGSIYLHCDPTMSHYLKLVMDVIFGKKKYRNEIVWKRTAHRKGTGGQDQTYGAINDHIFFYANGEQGFFDPYDYEKERKAKHRKLYDEHGRQYRDGPLDAPGASASGASVQPWRGINPADIGRHWAIPGSDKVPDWVDLPEDYDELNTQEKLEILDTCDMLHWPKKQGGKPRFRLYRDVEYRFKSLWDDINRAAGAERTGYPTQKPLALLDRIINVSSREGEVVFDPFCGCATTCVSAENLGRQWVGVDISAKAGELVMQRLGAGDAAIRHQDITLRSDLPQRNDLGPLPPPNSRENRVSLYGEQEGHCAGCRTHFEMRNLEVDHIIARKRGGTDHIDNLQLLCGNCNRIKGDRGMEYLRSKLELNS